MQSLTNYNFDFIPVQQQHQHLVITPIDIFCATIMTWTTTSIWPAAVPWTGEKIIVSILVDNSQLHWTTYYGEEPHRRCVEASHTKAALPSYSKSIVEAVCNIHIHLHHLFTPFPFFCFFSCTQITNIIIYVQLFSSD